MTPIINEIYRHFKGNLYRVIAIATHSETEEEMVVYQALYGDYKIYCRPLDSFTSEVDHEKYPDATQKMRFELLSSTVNLANIASIPVSSESNDNTPKATGPNVDTTVDTVDNDEANQDNANKNQLNPNVEKFINAKTTAERIDIVQRNKNSFTNDDLTTIAFINDITLDERLDFEERYRQLLSCLSTRNKYEALRLR